MDTVPLPNNLVQTTKVFYPHDASCAANWFAVDEQVCRGSFEEVLSACGAPPGAGGKTYGGTFTSACGAVWTVGFEAGTS